MVELDQPWDFMWLMRSETKLAAASLMDMSSDYKREGAHITQRQLFKQGIHLPERERVERCGELGG